MARTERSGHTTTDHDFIRRWVEERGGWPARVAGTESTGDDAGLIRIDFPGYSGAGSLERIEWEEWFQKFDESDLAFLHRDMSHGGGDLDRFNKLVRRGADDGGNSGSRGRSSSGSSRSGSKSRGGSSRATASKSSNSGGSRSTASKSSGGGSSSRSSSSRATASKSSNSGGSRSTASKSSGGGSTSRSSGGRTAAAKSSSKSSSKSTTTRRAAGGTASETSGRAAGNGRGAAAANPEIRELLKHELGDLLFAEKVFLKGTRTLAKEAQDPAVKQRVEEHVRETEGQIDRLQQAFRSIGEKPKPEKCEAALGLQKEHDSFKSDEKPSKMLLSAFDLGSGLRVEHYEIAAYRSAIAVASAMGERECAGLLKENLKEELAMAAFLEKSSLGVLRRMNA